MKLQAVVADFAVADRFESTKLEKKIEKKGKGYQAQAKMEPQHARRPSKQQQQVL